MVTTIHANSALALSQQTLKTTQHTSETILKNNSDLLPCRLIDFSVEDADGQLQAIERVALLPPGALFISGELHFSNFLIILFDETSFFVNFQGKRDVGACFWSTFQRFSQQFWAEIGL